MDVDKDSGQNLIQTIVYLYIDKYNTSSKNVMTCKFKFILHVKSFRKFLQQCGPPAPLNTSASLALIGSVCNTKLFCIDQYMLRRKSLVSTDTVCNYFVGQS